MAIVVAISSVLLFVFGAMAVDIGAAYAERRADQNSADAAALGGANALPDMGGSTSDAMRDAAAYVEVNLPKPDEGWDAAWAACRDDDHLALVDGQYGQCVSVSSFGTRIRVVIPERAVPTVLAGVIGISEIRVSAFAEAQIEYSFSANVLPFGIPPSAATASEACLRTATNGHQTELAVPCDGSDQGNFGTLDFTHFGNAALGTLESCGREQQIDRLNRNVILGVDHALSTLGARSPLSDAQACSDGADHGSRPNGTETRTGAPSLQAALISGVSNDKLVNRTLVGRLAQAVAVANWPVDAVQAEAPVLDNKPLWELIDPAAATSSGIAACQPVTIASSPTLAGSLDTGAARKAAMRRCLEAAASASEPLFTVDADADGIPDLAESRRFAYVPVMDQEFDRDLTKQAVTGTKTVYFVRFAPVYLESVVWTGCQGKDYVFRPDGVDNLVRDGVPWSGTVSKTCKADALTALMLPEAMLPQWINDNAPGTRGTPSVVLHR